MLRLETLRQLDPAALAEVITGYTSHEKYEASKRESDAGAAIELRLARLDEPYVKRYDPLDDDLLAMYAAALGHDLSLGAFDGGRLVAVALAEPRWWNQTLWVWEFHVAHGHRGQGLGRRLMDALAERAWAAGLRAIVCETQNTNVPAIRFYRRMGFEIDAIDLTYYTNHDAASGEVAIFMKRKAS